MAAPVAAAADHTDWQLVAVVASTALVIWISHVYAHGIGESISLSRRPDWSEFRAIFGRQLPILAAAAAPTLVLVIGAVDAFRDSRTVWLALGIGWFTLGVQGARYARVERLGPRGQPRSSR